VTTAFREYFEHLTPKGILQINHVFYPRVVATAAAAWQAAGGVDFRRHVAVFHYADEPDLLPTILIKRTPWTAAAVADARTFFAFSADRESRYTMAENPLDPRGSCLPDQFYSGAMTEAVVDSLPYDARPATDDRPFLRMVRARRDGSTSIRARAWTPRRRGRSIRVSIEAGCPRTGCTSPAPPR
jgi:hypothetical protein